MMKNIRKKSLVFFTLSRYAVYLFRFVFNIVLAKILGPLGFGVWGVYLLIAEYFSLSNLGLEHSVNVELSVTDKRHVSKTSGIISGSIVCVLTLSFTVMLGSALFKSFHILDLVQYELERNFLLICLLGVSMSVNKVLSNIYRAFGNLLRITITDLLFAIIPLIVALVIRVDIITTLLVAMIFVQMTNVAIFLIRFPYPFETAIDFGVIKRLVLVGLSLFVCNFSYTAIFIAARSTIGVFYDAREMGYFTLAYMVTNAVLLGSNAIIYAIYPRILWNLREGLDDAVTTRFLKDASTIYTRCLYLLVFSVMSLFPIVLLYLREYYPLLSALNFLLLSQAIFSSSVIHAALSFARKKALQVTLMSLVSTAAFAILSMIIGWSHSDFALIAFGVTLTVTAYSILQIRFAYRIISQDVSLAAVLTELFPMKYWPAVIVALLLNLTPLRAFSGAVGLVLFICFNRAGIFDLRIQLKSLLLEDRFAFPEGNHGKMAVEG